MSIPFLRAKTPEVRAAQMRNRGTRERVHAGAASALSFLVGQAVLTEATAHEMQREGDEEDPLWIADDPWGNLCWQVGLSVLPEAIAAVQGASCSCHR